jgi:hypothetical protein
VRYAFIDGVRIEASQSAPRRAYCRECKESVFLRCPAIIIPHWVHHSGSLCVHAGKTGPETEWHKNWKETVPEEFREKSIRRDGKLRRADIFAATKTVIELQHSSIASDEVCSREEFYGKNMFWMFDSDGRTRTLSRPSSGIRFNPIVQGMQVFKCELRDQIPGLFEAGRSKLVDLQSEVIRVIPHGMNSPRQFLCHIQDAGRVRRMVSNTCDEVMPSLDSFLLQASPEWASKKLMKTVLRERHTSSGKYMTDYCPHGYIAQEKPVEHLSRESWAWIMSEDE